MRERKAAKHETTTTTRRKMHVSLITTCDDHSSEMRIEGKTHFFFVLYSVKERWVLAIVTGSSMSSGETNSSCRWQWWLTTSVMQLAVNKFDFRGKRDRFDLKFLFGNSFRRFFVRFTTWEDFLSKRSNQIRWIIAIGIRTTIHPPSLIDISQIVCLFSIFIHLSRKLEEKPMASFGRIYLLWNAHRWVPSLVVAVVVVTRHRTNKGK